MRRELSDMRLGRKTLRPLRLCGNKLIMKNSSLLIILFLFIASSHLFSQEPTASECKQFRTGTFYVKSMPNVVITRDENFQVETDPVSGKYVKMSVKWTSDCTYELRLVKTNKREDKKMWKKMKVLVVTITATDEKSYKFSATSVIMSEPVNGTLIKK